MLAFHANIGLPCLYVLFEQDTLAFEERIFHNIFCFVCGNLGLPCLACRPAQDKLSGWEAEEGSRVCNAEERLFHSANIFEGCFSFSSYLSSLCQYHRASLIFHSANIIEGEYFHSANILQRHLFLYTNVLVIL